MRADPSSRPGLHSPPSILVVGEEADLRAFLRASLERWYQITETASCTEVTQHLKHCPPRALVIGALARPDQDGLESLLRAEETPPVLTLWSSVPPGDWVDASLRHPFTRVDLLRAVDRLLHTDGAKRPNGAASELNATGTQSAACCGQSIP